MPDNYKDLKKEEYTITSRIDLSELKPTTVKTKTQVGKDREYDIVYDLNILKKLGDKPRR
jgi:hypothetical protein